MDKVTGNLIFQKKNIPTSKECKELLQNTFNNLGLVKNHGKLCSYNERN